MSVSENRAGSAGAGSAGDRAVRADALQAEDELLAVLAGAGAVLAPHRGTTVALSYGSAAGELAACLSGVGIAVRSELAILELTGPASGLEHAIDGLLGGVLAPGGIRRGPATGWYRDGERRLLALCDTAHRERLRARLEFWTLREPTLSCDDLSEALTAIAVIGSRTGEVLRSLSVYGPAGDLRTVAPVTRVAREPSTLWLLRAGDDALALTPRANGPALWRRISEAGRPCRICAVGREALTRYRLLTRAGAAG